MHALHQKQHKRVGENAIDGCQPMPEGEAGRATWKWHLQPIPTEVNIDTLARALILAAKYIDHRSGDSPDDDVATLEELAAQLGNATAEEKASLIRAANELGFASWPDEMGIL